MARVCEHRQSPTGMRLLLLVSSSALQFHLLLRALLLTAAAGADFEDQKLTPKLHAPKIVDPRNDSVVLRCEYDLQGKDLYSVNWYKSDKMLYRFIPSLPTKGTSFPNESDVNVSIDRSNGTHLVLRGHRNIHKNMAAYQGTYFCEVSTEKPFLTGYAMANISTAVVPRESSPVLEGVAPNYQVGEQLEARCTSAPSLPATELTFYLNHKKVDRGKTRKNTLTIGDALVSTTILLSMPLDRYHFVGGSLSLSCRSTLPGIKLDREFKTEKRAFLAETDNQRLAQEPSAYNSALNLRSSTFSVFLILTTIIDLYCRFM